MANKKSEDTSTMAIAVSQDDKIDNQPVIDSQPASFSQIFSNATTLDYLCMAAGSLGSIITGLSLPVMNVLFGRILDSLNEDPGRFEETVNFLCLLFVIIGAVNLVSGFLQVGLWSIAGERQSQEFRVKYVRAILSQEVGWFDTCGAAQLSTRVADLTGKVQDGMGRKLGDFIQLLSQFLGSFAVGFYLSWRLTVVLLACFPLIAYSGTVLINAVGAATSKSLEQYAVAGGLASEALGAIRTVTALNLQPDIISKYRIFLFDAMNIGVNKGRDVGYGNGLLFFSCFLAYAIGFWYGTKLVADSIERGCSGNSCVTGGQIMSTFFSVLLGSMALGQAAPPFSSFAEARVAIFQIMSVIDRVPTIDGLSDQGETPEKKPDGQIELRAVDFAYPTRPDILICKDYSLVINPGENIALVGASGCGKSTIINLILRFYDPYRGDILLDGLSIKDINIQWLRSQIGYVGQEPILFAGTIGDNIAYGLDPSVMGTIDKQMLRERVVAAAKLANAHEFISSFPQGYDTDVGNGGVAMSGGQKQRIAIARALIKKPAVLLLDEATSALDAASERVVQQSIDALQKLKAQTTIVIAHRLSTIRNVDRICVIQDGKIAEMGSHDELMQSDGLYSDLVKLQIDSSDSLAIEEGVSIAEEIAESSPQRVVDGDEVKDLTDEERENLKASSSSSSPAVDEEVEVVITKEDRSRTVKLIWARVMEHKEYVVLSLVSAAFYGAVYPCWGLFLARSQNIFYLDSTHEMRMQSAAQSYLYVALAFTVLISATSMFWSTAQVGERVSCKIRSDLFEALMRREIAFYDQEVNNTGTLSTKLADECRSINKAFGESLAKFIQALFCLVIGFALAFSASWQIALTVLACFPLVIFASTIQMAKLSADHGDDDAPSASGNDNKAGGKKKSKASSAPPSQQQQQQDKSKTEEGSALTGTGHGAVISSAFTHMRTVCAFSMQHKVADHYTKLTNSISILRRKNALIAGIGFGFGQGVLFCIYALLFWFGSQLVKKGEIDFLQLMTSIFTIMFGAMGLGTAVSDLGDQQEGIIAAKSILETIEQAKVSPIDGLSTSGILPTTSVLGKLVFQDLHFHYPSRPDVEVCKDYNLTIEPGQLVALVGPSGSGKSTIMALLLRFYDPLSGRIYLDEHDIAELNVRWLRAQIGYVGQEPVLFSGTVAENIARGRKINTDEKPLLTLEEAMIISEQKRHQELYNSSGGRNALCFWKATQLFPKNAKQNEDVGDIELGSGSSVAVDPLAVDADVIDACVASNAHDFISTFTKGYHTDVGESSMMVSGGQKQRIAIARALIKKPAVLLLDEATSALDAASERVVQQSIEALQKLKAQTTIVIAHRLSTIRNADCIVVIDGGRVVQKGTHDELLLTGGLYSQLWYKQNSSSLQKSSSTNFQQ